MKQQSQVSHEIVASYDQSFQSNQVALQSAYRFLLRSVVTSTVAPACAIDDEIRKLVHLNRTRLTVDTPERRYMLVPALNSLLQWLEIVVGIVHASTCGQVIRTKNFNFTNTLRDGSVLCKVLHYYYPKYLQRHLIAPAAHSPTCTANSPHTAVHCNTNSLLGCQFHEDGGCPCCASDRAIAKHNFFLINRAAIKLFDIPIVLHSELESLADSFTLSDTVPTACNEKHRHHSRGRCEPPPPLEEFPSILFTAYLFAHMHHVSPIVHAVRVLRTYFYRRQLRR
uniref:Uncharacterized protein n=2 Tax=Lygus hesperus TaxID=30085 RepID=A0A146M5M7_LYGHE